MSTMSIVYSYHVVCSVILTMLVLDTSTAPIITTRSIKSPPPAAPAISATMAQSTPSPAASPTTAATVAASATNNKPITAAAYKTSSIMRPHKVATNTLSAANTRAASHTHPGSASPAHPGTRQRTVAEVQRMTSYLQEFGYLEELQSGEVTPSALRLNRAVRKFQRYTQIPVTGEIDDATIAQLDRPRCGEKDFTPVGGRQKRYILLRRRWERGREIDIQFKNHTADMTIDEQESIMSYVVDQWNSAADARLVFHHDGDQIEFPEINIHHTRYDNRGRPFSPFGVLAYAALPRNGDMYFDDTERWAEFHSNRPFTFSYTSVALHEMGHSLGLSHSNDPLAVMYAFYGPNRHALTIDDVAGAIALFGPN